MEANLYSIDGKVIGKIELPAVFSVEYRPDLIQKAVVTLQANKRQRYGSFPEAGMQTSAEYYGRRGNTFRQTINRGISRLPREKIGGGGLGRVRRVPQAVSGRRAHPPKKKDWTRKMNKKEYLLALKSAIACTSDPELVRRRGHVIPENLSLPIVVEDDFEKLRRTKDVLDVLSKLHLAEELERAKEKKIHAGKGKMRGRRYRKKKSVLIVFSNDLGLGKAANNIPGVDAVKLEALNVELLAPGTHAGRLTIWTNSALKALESFDEIFNPKSIKLYTTT